jgi:hypothetical protein
VMVRLLVDGWCYRDDVIQFPQIVE